jgi:hypothetical protein
VPIVGKKKLATTQVVDYSNYMMPNRMISGITASETGATSVHTDTMTEAFMRSGQFSLQEKDFENSDTFSMLQKIRQEQEK